MKCIASIGPMIFSLTKFNTAPMNTIKNSDYKYYDIEANIVVINFS